MNRDCWIDGVPVATLPADDRGLQYGDGLFETFAVKDGRICLLDLHLQRLAEGCGRLGLGMPPQDALRAELQAMAEGAVRAVLKLILTRGSGGRGYRPPAGAVTRRVLSRHPWPDYPEARAQDGVSLKVCDTRLAVQPRLAGMKHLNRLEQVLARAEWNDADGYQEGLMLDTEGRVIEGTMSNVFASPGEGVLLTPDLSRCGVAGVMRRHILEQAAKSGVTTREVQFTLDELLRAREIFLCNSVMGVWPVVRLAGKAFPTGPMTRRTQGWAEAC
ncbi:MAG TPA: aminodeoxychorismate lyase [Gammaproteobacteria bacterium]|nr:aminodeoxychorismate lyase [Gammaproteobacteria bacterium]